MREPVIERFPTAPGPPRNSETYLKRLNDARVTDAYHSLSIEGYRVTPALIERVRSGTWFRKPTRAISNSETPWRHGATGRPFRPCGRASSKF